MGGEDFKAKEGLIIISIVNQKGGVSKTTIAGMVVKEATWEQHYILFMGAIQKPKE